MFGCGGRICSRPYNSSSGLIVRSIEKQVQHSDMNLIPNNLAKPCPGANHGGKSTATLTCTLARLPPAFPDDNERRPECGVRVSGGFGIDEGHHGLPVGLGTGHALPG